MPVTQLPEPQTTFDAQQAADHYLGHLDQAIELAVKIRSGANLAGKDGTFAVWRQQVTILEQARRELQQVAFVTIKPTAFALQPIGSHAVGRGGAA